MGWQPTGGFYLGGLSCATFFVVQGWVSPSLPEPRASASAVRAVLSHSGRCQLFMHLWTKPSQAPLSLEILRRTRRVAMPSCTAFSDPAELMSPLQISLSEPAGEPVCKIGLLTDPLQGGQEKGKHSKRLLGYQHLLVFIEMEERFPQTSVVRRQ